jgi:hypothetical protein
MKPTIPITSNIIFPDGERYGEAMAETPETGAGSVSIPRPYKYDASIGVYSSFKGLLHHNRSHPTQLSQHINSPRFQFPTRSRRLL